MDESAHTPGLTMHQNNHNGLRSYPGHSNELGLPHSDYMANASLYLPLQSPDSGMGPGSSPAKFLLSDKSPQPHANLMTSPNPNNAMFSDDHFLLLSLDGQMYGHGSGHDDRHDDGTVKSEFLDNMDFIVPDDLGAESRAFPPLNFPQNTPSLAAHGRVGIMRNASLPGTIQLPILPGQNQTSYNQEHLFHKQRQQRHQALISLGGYAPPKHIRPDAVFTPLVSPAVTPLDQPLNNSNVGGQQMVPLREFEPLTSPALKATELHGNLPPSLIRPGLLTISSSERIRPLSTLGADDYSSGSSAKRKTPHLTPNLQAHTTSKHSKSPLINKGFENLPEASYDNMVKSSESTPMLPPQSKRVPIETGSSSTPGSVGPGSHPGSAGVGPGTMMGFTMNRLAEQQSKGINDTPTGKGQKSLRRLSRSSSQRSVDYSGKPYGSSLSETSPMLEAQQDSGEYMGLRNGKMPTKKTSHKIAEQGRRNRMNNAITELLLLIPPALHETAQIPSKATTVELAAEYITVLLKEIEDLKLRKDKKES